MALGHVIYLYEIDFKEHKIEYSAQNSWVMYNAGDKRIISFYINKYRSNSSNYILTDRVPIRNKHTLLVKHSKVTTGIVYQA